MGLRGPAPLPTQIKIVRGTDQPCRTARNEPKPRLRKPHCPEHLDEHARTEWKRLVPILMRMKVLTEADYMALANLCQVYSTMANAQEQLNKSGLLFKTQSGYVQQSPLIGIINGCVEKLNTLCREFGLTPSARTRVSARDDKEDEQADPWSQLRA